MAVVAALRKGIRLLFVGMLMGFCDLVPGVSGSSVAYLCGVYENLVEAINKPRVHLSFLIPLLLGILFALASFAIPLNYVMQNLVARSLLLSFFIGLSAACAVRAFIESKGAFVFLLFGAFCSAMLNMVSSLAFFESGALPLVFAGLLSGMALLFPAVSGAQILYLLGLYPFVIENLAHFVATGNISSFYVLFSLGSGVLGGIFIASKILRLLFNKFSKQLHGFFSGFIVLALPRLWPFEGILPSGASYWSAVALMGLGLMLGFTLSYTTRSSGVSK